MKGNKHNIPWRGFEYWEDYSPKKSFIQNIFSFFYLIVKAILRPRGSWSYSITVLSGKVTLSNSPREE